jgi:hypothetical protein
MTASLAYRKNHDAIWSGDAPFKYQRVLAHVTEGPVLEIGAAEGVLALLMAERGLDVTALELRRERHEAAVALQRHWLELDRKVGSASMMLGDIANGLDLLGGFQTLVAVRVIYHLRDRVGEVIGAAHERGVRNVVLCGNRNRAAMFYKNQGVDNSLGRFNYYASVDGMIEALTSAGYKVEDIVEQGDPIVVGRR